ncbi:phage repressor protein [Halosimplex pelagicum]|jgi:hypothetical protein|uniref:Phage repressor protein n=1 Tax=Halosimplex pelagicum TaxID=869886 RepID=A0A7D5TU97_9EURY|nr:phage repressor protein [Halosimplex pelagicum]QLH82134.1 phage repressor protein [Halosimplex pelagicum]
MVDEDLRKMADWTTRADDRIMEWLRDNGYHPPSAITEQLNDIGEGIDFSRQYITRRCNELHDRGLLDKNYQNYSLSSDGRKYLDGELDLSRLCD